MAPTRRPDDDGERHPPEVPDVLGAGDDARRKRAPGDHLGRPEKCPAVLAKTFADRELEQLVAVAVGRLPEHTSQHDAPSLERFPGPPLREFTGRPVEGVPLLDGQREIKRQRHAKRRGPLGRSIGEHVQHPRQAASREPREVAVRPAHPARHVDVRTAHKADPSTRYP